MKYFYSLFLILLWLMGIVLAKGFWSTFFAVIIPIYGWYLVVEAIALKYLVL